ncbi:MAG: hypothetical protein PHE88_06430 [Elusimicrobia bacterium]|nr:hypothetical protein [Elusimicrobiota bacterium]
MKKYLLLIIVSFILVGCGKNEKKSELILGSSPISNLVPMGTISCYSGKLNSSSTISFRPVNKHADGMSKEFYIYIKSIEISTAGNEWIKILDNSGNPLETKVKYGDIIRINTSSVSVPSDQYHGVRLVIEPKIKILSLHKWEDSSDTVVDITLNKLPSRIGMLVGSTDTKISAIDTISFTSANGYLVPFTIETGKETFLVFEFSVAWLGSSISDITDWELSLACRATRFLY